MMYSEKLVLEVKAGYGDRKLRRAISAFKKTFGHDPAHVGGYRDALLLLKFLRFAETYARTRNRRSAAIIQKLRRQLADSRRV